MDIERPTPRRAPGRSGAAVAIALVVALTAGLGAQLAGGTTTASAWISLASLVGSLALALQAQRAPRRARPSWRLLAGAALLSSYAHLDVATGNAHATLVVVRVVAVALAITALVRFPGTARSLSQWLQLGLEGWLLGGSLFVALWLLAIPPARLVDPPSGFALACVWVLLDLVLASVVVALARRIPREHRGGAVLLALAASMFTLGDLYRALFVSDASVGLVVDVAAFTAGIVLVVMAPWVDLSPFAWVEEAGPRPGSVRAPFVAACGAIGVSSVAWAIGRPADPLLTIVVVTLLASVVVSQTLLGRENEQLVDQVSHQADLFRDRATRDGLTGLPNRGEFTGRVELALTGPSRGHVGVLFVDLDGFKDVNDSYGHAIGDELLVEAATRLSAEVRERDVVARFGGDEFVAMLTDCSDERALEVAERLRTSLSAPYYVSGHEIVVSASIGLARPTTDDDAESALRNADLALYRAKSSGRDRVAVYEPAMHANVVRRLDLAARLRHALAWDNLALAYQPIVDLRTGAVHSFEALLRFEGSELEGWNVAEVIRTAEESGLISALGGWVLDAAVERLSLWRGAGHPARMSVNVSARQLEGGDFVRQVQNALLCHGVDASALTLEITEHHLVRDLDAGARELAALRALGVRIALDDFGTGYSSLSYLPRLPLDCLKMDRAMIAGVGGARDTVPAVLRLGRDLGLVVVAEGIETVEQLVLLREAGATLGQGFLFAPALDVAAATRLVAEGRVTLPVGTVSMGRTFVSDDETASVIA